MMDAWQVLEFFKMERLWLLNFLGGRESRISGLDYLATTTGCSAGALHLSSLVLRPRQVQMRRACLLLLRSWLSCPVLWDRRPYLAMSSAPRHRVSGTVSHILRLLLDQVSPGLVLGSSPARHTGTKQGSRSHPKACTVAKGWLLAG